MIARLLKFGCAAGIAVLISWDPALAQQKQKPYPWERDAQRQLNPEIRDPVAEQQRKLRRQEAERLGLPANPNFNRPPDAPAPTAPDIQRYTRWDLDRDGYISQQEYFGARQGRDLLGFRGERINKRHRSRLRSNFRRADTDRDGRISVRELENLRNQRF